MKKAYSVPVVTVKIGNPNTKKQQQHKTSFRIDYINSKTKPNYSDIPETIACYFWHVSEVLAKRAVKTNFCKSGTNIAYDLFIESVTFGNSENINFDDCFSVAYETLVLLYRAKQINSFSSVFSLIEHINKEEEQKRKEQKTLERFSAKEETEKVLKESDIVRLSDTTWNNRKSVYSAVNSYIKAQKTNHGKITVNPFTDFITESELFDEEDIIIQSATTQDNAFSPVDDIEKAEDKLQETFIIQLLKKALSENTRVKQIDKVINCFILSQNGYTQTEIAIKMHVSQQAIARYIGYIKTACQNNSIVAKELKKLYYGY
jgi:hypothetical protein